MTPVCSFFVLVGRFDGKGMGGEQGRRDRRRKRRRGGEDGINWSGRGRETHARLSACRGVR